MASSPQYKKAYYQNNKERWKTFTSQQKESRFEFNLMNSYGMTMVEFNAR